MKNKKPRALTPEELFQRELENCLKVGTFAGAAAIVAETLGRSQRSIELIRGYARLAIAANSRIQAHHMVVIRFPDIMTDEIRKEYRQMPRDK